LFLFPAKKPQRTPSWTDLFAARTSITPPPLHRSSAREITMLRNRFMPALRRATVLCLVLAPLHAALAQGGAAGVAAGAAAADTVLTAIGGLSTWIDQQSNDTAVATLGSAFGKHGLLTNEEKDTGYFFASANAPAENEHGRGVGIAFASESAFGSWAGAETDPFAIAWTKPLHGLPDDHHAKGFASASVDGHVKATTQQADLTAQIVAPPDPPPIDPSTRCGGPDQPGGICTEYPGWDYQPASGVDGDVWLTVAIPADSFVIQAGADVAGSTSSALWEYLVEVNGEQKFLTRVAIDEAGTLTVSGVDGVAGLDASAFSTSFSDGVFGAALASNVTIDGTPYLVTDILLDHLDIEPALDQVLRTEADFEISVSSQLSMSADIAAIPEPSPLVLISLGLVLTGAFEWRRRRGRTLGSRE
jgi:hypothetical protein